jgi:cob(I)alamin adenosyltransferase
LASESGVNPQVLVFLNRLGDDLFLMAREANRDDGRTETEVKY